jgi:5-oxoprolinase (ATP-hydrolysing) subunit A
MKNIIQHIDLNADLGESFGAWTLGNDLEVLKWVSSANVACGFHAGDPLTLYRTLEAAKKAGVAVGAHPGTPDKVGFGRRALECSFEEVYTDVLYQLGALAGIARVQGMTLSHVKAHGALYHMAATQPEVARAIAQATIDFDPRLAVVVMAGTPVTHAETAALERGLSVRREGFPERAYLADGKIAPRTMPGSSLHDPLEVANRALEMVLHGFVTTLEGGTVPLSVDTLCIHGDNPNAPQIAKTVRETLEGAGIRVVTPQNIKHTI